MENVAAAGLLLIIKNIFEKLSSEPSLTPAFSAFLVVYQHIWVVFRLEGVD